MQHHFLPLNTTLERGRYTIIRKLGQGGYGITYQAKDNRLDTDVAIKELFIRGYCVRNTKHSTIDLQDFTFTDFNAAKRNFVKEARTLKQFDHPSIVRVTDVFEENNTAYLVMNLIEGTTLQDQIEKTKKPVSTSQMNIWLEQLVAALSLIHRKNFYHLDIKPSNIMIRQDDQRAILIDFGLCKEMTTAKEVEISQLGYSEGYSAPELKNGTFPVYKKYPALDIYSLAATTLFMLTAQHPHAMVNFSQSLKEQKVKPYQLYSIQKGLSTSPIERQATIKEFLFQVTDIETIEPPALLKINNSDDTILIPQTSNKSKTTNKVLPWSIAAVVALFMLSFLWLNNNSLSEPPIDDTLSEVNKTDIKKPNRIASSSITDIDQPTENKVDKVKIEPKKEVEKAVAKPKLISFSGNVQPKMSISLNSESANYLLDVRINAPLNNNFMGTCTVTDAQDSKRSATFQIAGSYNQRQILSFQSTELIRNKGDFSYCNFEVNAHYNQQTHSFRSVTFKPLGNTPECKALKGGNAKINLR